MQTSKFRTPYDRDYRSAITIPDTPQDRRTKQSFKDDADVNNILKKFNKTGKLPDLIQSSPRYGDFSDVPSYQESLEIVARASEQFSALPARVREKFGNDPASFLAFASDPANGAELRVLTGEPLSPPGQPGAAETPPAGTSPAGGEK